LELTFELMASHANRQLGKMTDRYLLIRDEQQPRELNVVDNYQAGEIRSAKNLSGGESFIVSLTLALGLSKMARRKVRVDSLFLDEGFWTLDEEALETALETYPPAAGRQADRNHFPRICNERKNQHTDKHHTSLRRPQLTVRTGLYKGRKTGQ